jgi:phospholipid-translocating ATPase
MEVNWLSKMLFLMMTLLGLLLVAADGFSGQWYLTWFRQILLLSSIIPISMRINLDLAKIYYSLMI